MDGADIGVHPGDVLAGKYRVERVLGQGGMGVVVAAHHIQLDEKVALKFLLPEALKNPEAVGRFDREARAAVRIKSEHVARVSDVGRLATGAPYMVMEYLEGVDLGGWIKQRGPMEVDQAAEFALQACEAIAEAHALGIVHRDLKPANLFCVRRADGLLSIKVLDFGISKLTVLGADKEMTRTSAVLGSPLYMSPEQVLSSKGVDARTDIWSLGVVLFELVTGRMPFEAEAVTELVVKIATAPPVPIRNVRPNLPAGFDHVVMHCLEKDRALRFQNVADLAIALRDYAPPRAKASVERILRTMHAAGVSQAVLPPSGEFRAAHGEPQAPVPTGAAWGTTGVGPKPDRRALVGVVAAAGLMLVAGLIGTGVVLARRHAAARTAATTIGSGTSVPTSVSASAVAVVPPPLQVVAAPSTSPAADTPSAAPASTTTMTATTPAAAPRHWGAPPPVAAVVAPATPQAVARPANCSPPFTIDAKGHRVAKPECM